MAVTSASENKGQKIINYDDLLSSYRLEKMKEAAVLICFYKQNDEYYFPLIKRPMHEKNHPGQIALPGGSKENNESLEETALREAFEAHGEVERAKVIHDRETGRSRGFGFVEMPNQAEAEAALEAMEGKELMGRAIRCNESESRERRS